MSDPITFKSGGCGSGNCACKAGALRNERGPMDDTDYGTPLRHSDVDVTLEIDGQMISVPAGTSVMRAAAEAGVNIPKLCATDSLEPFGSCRLCLRCARRSSHTARCGPRPSPGARRPRAARCRSRRALPR